jgi:putative membrane fusion protein
MDPKSISLDKYGINTSNMSRNEKKMLFESWFSFIPNDFKRMLNENPNSKIAMEVVDFCDQYYDELYEQFFSKDVIFSSGYVIYSVDGYENAVSVENLDKLSAETLKNISPGAVPSNAVCKIVSDYEWYIACTVPFSESLNLKSGNKVTIRTDLQSVSEMDVTVKYINKQSVDGDAVVILASDTMNSELAGLRSIDITLVYREYDGLKVDNRAIRFVDGQKGVYVYIASQVKFIPVEVLWQGENYSIVKQETSDKKVLRIYDEVIIKGKNLVVSKLKSKEVLINGIINTLEFR